MLKNLMEEDKQLDFNQPLLSVRRFSSTPVASEADEKKKVDKPIPKLPPLPFYKSELKSGPIRNPGTVPFVWEKTPGKPKDERKFRPLFPNQPPVAPRLPPGRVPNIKKDSTDKGSRNTVSTTESQTVDALPSSKEVLESDKISTPAREDHKSSSNSEDGDDDEAYMDALDILSRSESFSMTCSVSGVSGLDGPDVKPSGSFSTDPQTRDFMMGRFLPAAKAMASEGPQYTPKKHSVVVREQPRQVSRVANGDRRRLPNQYQPNDLPPYAQELRMRLVESDSESDIYEGSDIMSAKVCGLFPRFGVRSSLCLLNPVPGMKMQSQFPASSVRRARPNSSSSASSCSETKIELGVPEKAINTGQSGFDAHKSKRRNFQELLAENVEWEVGSGIPVVEKTLYIDSVHTAKSLSSNSSSSDYKGNDIEVPEKGNEIEDSLSMDSSLQDIKCVSVATEKKATRPGSSESVDSCSSSDMKDVSRRDRDLIQDSLELVDSKLADEVSFVPESQCIEKSDKKFSLARPKLDKHNGIDFATPAVAVVKLRTEESIDLESRRLVRFGTEVSSDHDSFLRTALSLPSPKCPTESWLKRALPVASSRNSRSSLAARIGISSPMTSPLDPKWETIVKTSHLQQGNGRFSEEHLSPIPEAN